MRSLAVSTQAATQAEVVRPIIIALLDMLPAHVAVCSAPFSLTIDGVTYTGVGHLGAVSAIDEGVEVKPYGIQLTLSGIDPALLSGALTQHYQGRDATVSLVLVDDAHRIIGSAVTLFRGRMDTMDVALGDTATITLSVESRLADWQRPRTRRYTDRDQQAEYPGDLGFEFVPATTEKEITWGFS